MYILYLSLQLSVSVCTLTMFQLSLYYKGVAVFNSAGPVIQRHGGEHGYVTDGRRTSYSSIIRDVDSLKKADEIVAEVNQHLVSEGHKPLTGFRYNHQEYDVLPMQGE